MTRLLSASPIFWLAIVTTALTIGWSVRLIRNHSHSHIKLCAYVVFQVCTFQGVQMLRDSGMLRFHLNQTMSTCIQLSFPVLYLVLVVILHNYNAANRKRDVQLRLVDAELGEFAFTAHRTGTKSCGESCESKRPAKIDHS